MAKRGARLRSSVAVEPARLIHSHTPLVYSQTVDQSRHQKFGIAILEIADEGETAKESIHCRRKQILKL